MNDEYRGIISELSEMKTPDGSTIDITHTTPGKKFIQFYLNSKEDFLEYLYELDYDLLEDNDGILTFTLVGHSVFRVNTNEKDGE
jgi:hypothetical protein